MSCPMTTHFTCVNQTGHIIPCCEFEIKNISDFKKITEDNYHASVGFEQIIKTLKIGNWPSGCQRCHENEKIGRSSLRTQSLQFIKKNIPVTNFRNTFIQLRLSNLCQLQCITCSADFSSSIANKNNPSNKHIELDASQMNSLKKLITAATDTIYFAGGEPLLHKQHIEILEHLLENKLLPKLIYNSSLNVSPVRLQKIESLWSNFQSVQIIVSIDGFKERNDFLRTGSNYKIVEKNLFALQKKYLISINSVISTKSIPYIAEFIFHTETELNIPSVRHNLSILINPKHLSIQNLSAEQKNNQTTELLNIITLDQKRKHDINSILLYMHNIDLNFNNSSKILKKFNKFKQINTLFKRKKSFEFILQHIEKVEKINLTTIIETGTARQKGNWIGDGQSTIIWDWLANEILNLNIYSIDIDIDAIETAQSQTKNITYCHGNSLDILKKIDKQILEKTAVLYLDSLGVNYQNSHESAEHTLFELMCVYAYLPKGCLVVVDDCISVNVGKHFLVKRFFEQQNVPLAFSGYQMGWII